MGGPLCRGVHGTEGWRDSRNLVLLIIALHATKEL